MGVNEINECDVKIVFPLIVECDVTNPTTDISSDGSITLLINGGTPPYDITWNDGNVGITIINLTQGSYTAVVVDYYGVSATTTCSLVRPEPETTTNYVVRECCPETLYWTLPNGKLTDFSTAVPVYDCEDIGTCFRSVTNDIKQYYCDDGILISSQWEYEIKPCGVKAIKGEACEVYWYFIRNEDLTMSVYYVSDNGVGGYDIYSDVNCCSEEYFQRWSNSFEDDINRGNCVFSYTGTGFFDWFNRIIDLSDDDSNLHFYPYYVSETNECLVSGDTSGGVGEEIVTVDKTYNVTNKVIKSDDGICYNVISPTLLEPTITIDSTTIYDDCEECNPSQVLYDICMVITNGGMVYNNFYPSESYNSKNAWISDDGLKRIVWDNVQNYWYVSGSSYNIINTNTDYPPINGWQLLGSPATISVSLGECDIVANLSGNVVINNPTCECDGSITLTALDGVPPYQYSINNGNTFGDSPLFNGLCGGVYSWVIKDSEDNIFTGVEVMNQPSAIINYTLRASRTYASTNNGGIIGPATFSQRYSITVEPPLPAGVFVIFDINFDNNYQTSPNPNSYLFTITNVLTKNNVSIPNSSDNTIVSSVPMVSPCVLATDKKYTYKYTTIWNNVTIGSGDVVKFESAITSTYNCENSTPEPLTLGEEGGIYSFDLEGRAGSICCTSTIFNTNLINVTNPRLSGDQCSKVKIGWEYFYNRS